MFVSSQGKLTPYSAKPLVYKATTIHLVVKIWIASITLTLRGCKPLLRGQPDKSQQGPCVVIPLWGQWTQRNVGYSRTAFETGVISWKSTLLIPLRIHEYVSDLSVYGRKIDNTLIIMTVLKIIQYLPKFANRTEETKDIFKSYYY